MIMDLEVITSSSQRAFRECAKKYEYRYMRGYKTKTTPAYFAFGTAIHASLENWYGNLAHDVVYPSETDQARGNAMMTAYFQHFKKDRENWKVLHTEHEFLLEHNANKLAGKIDMIVEDEVGDVWFVEHKTVSTPPRKEDLQMDPQFLNYSLAMSKMNTKVKGWIYNGLVKPKQKMFKHELLHQYEERIYRAILAEPDEYFVRHMQPITKESVALASALNYEVVTAMGTAKILGLYPRNPHACHGRFGNERCEFYDACRNVTPIELLTTVEKKERMHTELSEGVQL